jgi:hypothetical protein
MNTNPRPIEVTILAWLYLVAGCVLFAARFRTLLAWEQGSVWAESTELAAVVSGIFMLLGKNWARWLAVAWIAFHVVLSALHSWGEAVMHGLFCVAFAWILFRPESSRYFRRTQAEAS